MAAVNSFNSFKFLKEKIIFLPCMYLCLHANYSLIFNKFAVEFSHSCQLSCQMVYKFYQKFVATDSVAYYTLHTICKQQQTLDEWQKWGSLQMKCTRWFAMFHETFFMKHGIVFQKWFSNKHLCWIKPVSHHLQTTMKQRWNNEIDAKHEFYIEILCSILQKGFSLCILRRVSPDRVVFGWTQKRFFTVVKSESTKYIFTTNCWQRQCVIIFSSCSCNSTILH